jgi:hypothetical protein
VLVTEKQAASVQTAVFTKPEETDDFRFENRWLRLYSVGVILMNDYSAMVE